jgi:uncharacterized repeat protein (TIGR04052 family)
MNLVKLYPLRILAGLLPIFLIACSSSDSIDADVTRDVAVEFAAKVNGADFNCGQTYTGVGTGGHDFVVNDFRMYVHNASISDPTSASEYPVDLVQDGVWQLDDLTLLDFEDGCATGTPELNSNINGQVTVPAGIDMSQLQVCFTVGVPADKNHLDSATAASPLNASGLLWAWKVGRKYLRIDGFGDPGVLNNPFNLHLGAQGCPGASPTAPPTSECTVPNTMRVCVDAFDPATHRVAVDIGSVLEGNDVSINLAGGPTARPGCMSFIDDNDCEEIMPRLGLDYAYGRVSGTASIYTGGQRMFSRE